MSRRLLATALALLVLGSAAPPKPTEPLDLNTASHAQLMRLPGIGKKRAIAVVSYRARQRFRRKEDLLRVKGIGRRLFKRLKPYVRVSQPGKVKAAEPRQRSKTDSELAKDRDGDRKVDGNP